MIVITVSFRVGSAFLELSRVVGCLRLQEVSHVPPGGVVLTRISARWVFNSSVVAKHAEQVHSLALYDMLSIRRRQSGRTREIGRSTE